MELRHLRSFVYVAETKSFSTAATRCCVTQSAVSQHIRAWRTSWAANYLSALRTALCSPKAAKPCCLVPKKY